MTPADYDFLCRLLRERSGLSLGEGKAYLLEARLVPLAQSYALSGLDALVAELRTGRDQRLRDAVVEAMTTNETSFFRDRTPFDELRDRLLPDLIEARRTTRSFRIWSAAASTGQEAYSIAMTLADSFPELDSWSVEIVATDIAAAMTERGRAGLFTTFEVQRGLPVQMLVKYFRQADTQWQVAEPIRRRVRWERANLLEDFRRLGTFDLVFCRNVLIYFTPETKSDVLARIARQMRPDGALILGAAETVLGLTDAFRRDASCKSAVYRTAPTAVAAR
ncbi:MAG TPA: protein-glutamate O-methyltransferase CheR [Planctomycetaceae bacterium]